MALTPIVIWFATIAYGLSAIQWTRLPECADLGIKQSYDSRFYCFTQYFHIHLSLNVIVVFLIVIKIFTSVKYNFLGDASRIERKISRMSHV